MAAILALDLGSTQLKLMVLNDRAEVTYIGTQGYATAAADGGVLEQNPDDWLRALVSGMKQLRETVDVQAIDAVSFSGHMSGVVLTDSSGSACRPCIMLSDSRSSRECEELTEHVGSLVRERTGNPVINAFSLPKLLWLKRNEPDAWKRAKYFLSPKDYLRLFFTGSMATDCTDAYNTLCIDRESAQWCEEIIRESGLDAAHFPPVLRPDACAGRVSRHCADILGLREGTPVYAGGADMACGALGMGLFDPGVSALTLGTCATFLAPVAQPDMRFFGQVTYHLHALPGLCYALGSHFNGGLAVNWLSQLFDSEGKLDYDRVADLARQAAQVPAGSQGVMTLPFLAGSGSPYFRATDRLCVVGVSTSTGRAQLMRSLLEGITLNLNQTKEAFARMTTGGLNAVYLGGGGCKVAPWPQMIADIFGMPVQEVVNADASTVGAAILGGVGSGIFADAREVARRMRSVRRTLMPQPAVQPAYRNLYRQYLALYQLMVHAGDPKENDR